MARTKADDYVQELQDLAHESGGVLMPQTVVDWARDNPESALYHHFTWDDTEAAQAYRLWQARTLIQHVTVIVVEGKSDPVRAFVSMVEDRVQPQGGYRLLVDVLSDPERRKALLKQAIDEFRTWRRKYEQLKELAGIFAAADALESPG